jgi:hypothetical protein
MLHRRAMPVDLTSVDANIEWANQHINELDARILVLRASNGYAVVFEPDPTTPNVGNQVLHINEPAATAMRTEISLRVGDIAHAARRALDHLIFAVVPEADRTLGTAFPIWRHPRRPTVQQYESLVGAKVNGSSNRARDVRDLLKNMEPYEGGGHEPLWTLDYLDIVDKHRLLVSTPVTAQGITINIAAFLAEMGHESIGPGPGDEIAYAFNGPYEPVKDGDVVLGNVPAQEQHKIGAYLPIGLGEPEPIKYQPVTPTMAQLVQFAASVIDKFRPML